MSLIQRLARSNGNPERAIVALRSVNQQLEFDLLQYRAQFEPNQPRTVGSNYCLRNSKRNGPNCPFRKAESTYLFRRIAYSNGEPRRTITALRLLNQRLELELSQYPHLSQIGIFDLLTDLDLELDVEDNLGRCFLARNRCPESSDVQHSAKCSRRF